MSRAAPALAALLCCAPLLACQPHEAAGGAGYDVIVVGSGAGGGPLAARLARAGKRVLLLEAGRDAGGALAYEVPAMHALSTEDAAMAWWYFVQHHAEASLDLEDSKHTPDGILYPRGSALGGSSAVNAMVTVLPSRSDWDRLAELSGSRAFRAAAMDDAYARVREWLGVTVPDPALALGDARVTAFLAAASKSSGDDTTLAAESLGSLLTRDVNESLARGEATGLFRLPLASKDGKRNGPRERILDTQARGFPLDVMTGAFVTRIVWDGTRAAGVEYVRSPDVYAASLAQKDAPAARQVALAAQEVVISAGTFNSPQILTLSGVGDPSQLASLGIRTVVARPGVGKNLQDRIEAPVVTEIDRPLDVVARCRLGDAPDPCLDDWRDGRGVYTTSGFLASVLTRSSDDAPLADLQIFAVPTDARGYYPGYSKDSAKAKDRFSWLVLKAHTHNKDGEVRLASDDPFARPRIAFNSFDESAGLADSDLRAVVTAIQRVRTFVDRAADALPADRLTEVWPGRAVASDDDVARFVFKEHWGHHACCTDKMGRTGDPGAVVDARFRVIGAEHLRVVDASVFPEIPGTFIALPTYMLSEKAAELILEDDP